MQVSIQTTSGLERRLTIGVPADRIDSEVNTRLQKAAGTVRIDGFRKGKVPMRVLKQRFGAGVRQEVLGEVMNQTFSEAVVQEKLKPAGMPEIETKTAEEGKDLEYVATFEVFPEIELKSFASIEVEKLSAKVEDADVAKMVSTLREQQGEFAVVERAAVDGDKVNIDYAGTKEGVAFEGGSAEAADLTLGSNQMIPGFEAGIVGMKAGEEKVLALAFPDEYHSEELKGAAVEFKVTLNSVSEKAPAELNDEFFAKFGVSEGGEEKFLTDVRENMERELENAAKSKTKNQVMDALLDLHAELQVPKALAKEEIKVLRKQMVQQFGGGAENLDLDSLLPDDMFQEQAERRVKLGLILNELISSKEIKADAAKVKETIEGFASTYEDPQEVINYYYGNPQQLQQVESMVVEDMVVEHILSESKVTEKESTYDEVLAPAAPPEPEEGEAE
ncbi:trigger factor [Dasania marina]|uniref:trigger factor n=1 Tax=Dasania marina TaxID=471499 RepID=UPI00036EA028|nr:trigger factor [Dasania marina]